MSKSVVADALEAIRRLTEENETLDLAIKGFGASAPMSPHAPLRPCAEAGCPALVVRGRCPLHTQVQEHRRGSRIDRGYDKHWLRLRAWYMAQPENQLCVVCRKQGKVRLTAEVDHIVPFKGLHDPKRLDPQNLQPLCSYHHHMKHGTSTGGDT